MAYDEKAFTEGINENMEGDPYGTAMYLIREALKGAMDNAGAMNDEEHSRLVKLNRLHAELDRF